MQQGLLVPDELIIKVLLDEVKDQPSSSIILDGFPRTLYQAQELNKNMHIDLVVEIKVPHEVIVQRMANRWVHIPTGRTYSLDYNPPKQAGLDDITGEPLQQREDDKPAVVKKRLEHYDEMINPLLEYYRSLPNCSVQSFSGTMSDAIYPQVSAYLKTQLQKRRVC
jgi:nucleoside-triphosphate--adenylate kinase